MYIYKCSSSSSDGGGSSNTWMAVRAATMAGLPNPWVMSEKCVKWRWMFGSKMICGRVLHSGDRSWLSKSISSLVICLRTIPEEDDDVPSEDKWRENKKGMRTCNSFNKFTVRVKLFLLFYQPNVSPLNQPIFLFFCIQFDFKAAPIL